MARIPGADLDRTDDELIAPAQEFSATENPTDTQPDTLAFVSTPNAVLRLVESPLKTVEVRFEPLLAGEYASGALRSLRWRLLNFPCAGVDGAIKQTLALP